MYLGVSEVTLDYFVPIISVMIILLNVLEVYTIFACRGDKALATSLIFLLNLSLSDMFVGIGLLIFSLIHHLGNDVIKSEFLKITRVFLMRFSLTFSSLSIITLTFTRMFAVTKPIRYKKAKRPLAVRVCVAIWFVSIVFAGFIYGMHRFIPTIVLTEYGNILYPVICYPTIALCCVSFYKIIKTIRKQREFRLRHSLYCTLQKYRDKIEYGKNIKDGDAVHDGDDKMEDVEITSTKNTKLRITSNRLANETDGVQDQMNKIFEIQLLKLTGATIIIFIFCWFPVSTFVLLSLNKETFSWHGDENILMCLYEVALSNSFLNAIIYFFYTRSYRKKRIVCQISSNEKKSKTR